MKHLISLLILILNFLHSFGQADKEVIKQVISDNVLKRMMPPGNAWPTRLVILKKPTFRPDLEPNKFISYKRQYKNLEKETFESFSLASKSDLVLDMDSIKNVQLIGIDSLEQFSKYYISDPKFFPFFVELSNVGLNPSKTQALIYFGYSNGGMAGGGAYLIYKKKKNGWKMAKRIMIWSS